MAILALIAVGIGVGSHIVYENVRERWHARRLDRLNRTYGL